MKRVLLIEDDRVLRENTAELLELSNYQVFTAPDGKKGIDSLKENLPDIIICDIMMPELDGYGVLEALSKDELTKRIPFIFLSAKTERKDVRKGMELGADDYLTKPFEESELIGAIESRLTKVELLKEIRATNDLSESSINMRTIDDLKNYIDDNGEEIGFDAGEFIYREGMYPNMVFLVVKGVVKTHKLDEMGKELITGIYKPDDFFGFSPFNHNVPYSEFASALVKTQLVGLPKEKLKKLLDENQDLAMVLIQMLSENLSETKEQLLQMAYGSVRKKTASTLLKFSERLKKDSHGNIHILRSDLASVAGMATETLIRTLSSFKKEGLIKIEERNIRILDEEQLRKIN